MVREGILKVVPFSTSFIDRPTEIERIKNLLAKPECRLLTLAGVGGSGKTRLAVEIAARQTAYFRDGVYFVALQPLPDSGLLASTIADAIGVSFSGQKEPVAQLLHHLREKQMLLLLDNFEHLLDGIPLLMQILETTRQVKLLVTSREVLNIQPEWLCHVGGLPFPTGSNVEDLEAYGSTRLFIERARRLQPDFPSEDEQSNIARICQLVEGLPLAVEMAASWIGVLPCAIIEAELQQNLDFLTTRLADQPDRHRSLHAVFEQSWHHLTNEQHASFKRLSVFRGGFDSDAAREVSGASPSMLSDFVDKSLLTSTESGRYHIHELLRQFAQHKVEDVKELMELRDRHCDHYANYLEKRRQFVIDGRHLELIRDVTAELKNIRVAWDWAIQRGNIDAIRKSVTSYYYYCQFQSRYQEGMQALEGAVNFLFQHEQAFAGNALLADLLNAQGWLLIRLGRFEQAQARFRRCLGILNGKNISLSPAIGSNPLAGLAILAVIHGSYEQAVELGRRALQLGESRGENSFLAFAHYALASATLAQGNYREARRHARQACTFAQFTHNRWFLAYCLIAWGEAAGSEGDWSEAKRHYQASYAIRRAFDDSEGMAAALNHLGEAALHEGDFGEAQRLYSQSLELYQKIDDPGGLASARHGLGRSAFARRDYPASAGHLRKAGQIAAAIGFVSLNLSVIASAGELFLRIGQTKKGLEYLNAVSDHPSCDRVTRDRARELIESYGEGAARGAEPNSFDALNAMLSIDLIEFAENPGFARPDAFDPSEQERQALTEPLTLREREVLHLLAEGLSNPAIAARLIVSIGTIKAHTNHIYRKLGVKNRVQAVSRARELHFF